MLFRSAGVHTQEHKQKKQMNRHGGWAQNVCIFLMFFCTPPPPPLNMRATLLKSGAYNPWNPVPLGNSNALRNFVFIYFSNGTA